MQCQRIPIVAGLREEILQLLGVGGGLVARGGSRRVYCFACVDKKVKNPGSDDLGRLSKVTA